MKRIDRKHQLYETLVQSHGGQLFRFAARLSGCVHKAEELVQETYCEAWRSIGSLRDSDRAKAWLFRILRRRFAHALQAQKRQVPTTDSEQLQDVVETNQYDMLDALSDQELLRNALDALDDRFKEPFLLMFADGLTCREIAEATEVPLGTVLSRIHRARVFLRKKVRQLEGAEAHVRQSYSSRGISSLDKRSVAVIE